MTKFYLAMRFVGGSGIQYYSPVVQDGRLTDPVKIAADLAKKNQQRQDESNTLPLAAELVEWAVLSASGQLLAASNGAECVFALDAWAHSVVCDYSESGLCLYGFGVARSLRLAWLYGVRPLRMSDVSYTTEATAAIAVCAGAGGHQVVLRDPYSLTGLGSQGVSLAGLLQYCGEDVSDADVAAWDVVEEAKTVKFLADKLGL